MGRATFSHAAYRAASETYVPKTGPATRLAEQQAHSTGKLHELVDPAGHGVIRPSRVRLEERDDGLWVMTIGCSMPIETRVDTTGSMGHNVDVALRVLEKAYDLCSSVLPGYDVHMATGIFGDVVDKFVLCRPQFEMLAEKLVEQLTLMVPERNGGDMTEDPQYGLFGAAYLTRTYANSIGLRRYDFTVSDAPGREYLSERQLTRIFGPDVFDKVKYNGFHIDRNNLPSTHEVVADLLDQAHAFFLQVGSSRATERFWTDVFGPERVVVLPDTEFLPQVQATIIGLTEGTLALDGVEEFLRENNVNAGDARSIVRSVSNIPIGAQVPLREAIEAQGRHVPRKGDLYLNKPDLFAGTDIWPVDPDEALEFVPVTPDDMEELDDGPNWL